jgi:peptidoglycan hydrolase-like protein with peptidoglycan-binding domain
MVKGALLGILLIALGGCATTQRKGDLENQALRNELSVLQAQMQAKDDQILNLTKELEELKQQETKTEVLNLDFKTKIQPSKKIVGEIKSRPNVRQTQIALRNAGYTYVIIDGIMGKVTRRAIREFQKVHNLNVTGKVNGETWALLKEYLYKK